MSITFTGAAGDELNVSNNNAHMLFAAMGVTPDYCGTVSVSDLPNVRRNLLRALNKQEQYTTPTIEERTPFVNGDSIDSHVFISFGRDAEYVESRLTMLLRIVVQAQEREVPIRWC